MGADLVRERYGDADGAAPVLGLPVTTPSRRRRKNDTANRSIYFFRIDAGAGDDGVPITVDLHPTLQKLDSLPFRPVEDGGRYVSSGDADQCVWVDEVGEICKIRFANIRRNALP